MSSYQAYAGVSTEEWARIAAYAEKTDQSTCEVAKEYAGYGVKHE